MICTFQSALINPIIFWLINILRLYYIFSRSCNHLVEKEFLCEECGKRFQTKTHLVFHSKIHLPPEDKPFKCQFCTRTFAYNHDCIHHMRLHIGEKPFKCTQCDKAFHRKSYLTEHMFVHTGVSRYQCDTCQVCSTICVYFNLFLFRYVYLMSQRRLYSSNLSEKSSFSDSALFNPHIFKSFSKFDFLSYNTRFFRYCNQRFFFSFMNVGIL